RDDGAEGEDRAEPVAVDGARDEEPERRSRLVEDPDDAPHELDVAAEEADARLLADALRLRDVTEERDREDRRPDRRAEPDHLERDRLLPVEYAGEDESHDDGERDDAAEVAEAPA